MPVDEFWHGDPQLLNSYKKAYESKIYTESWLFGLYNNLALCDFGNKFLKFKGRDKKELHYPDKPKSVFEKPKEKITVENIEEKHRSLMQRNNEWIKGLINKEK